MSVIDNALTNEVRIEESWLVINLGCSYTAYFGSDNRGAAGEEGGADRLVGPEPDTDGGRPVGAPHRIRAAPEGAGLREGP